MLDHFSKMVSLLVIAGGLFLFVMIAPFLIWAVVMLLIGGICLAILIFMVYAIKEYVKEQKNQD